HGRGQAHAPTFRRQTYNNRCPSLERIFMTTHQQTPVETKTLEQLCINTIRALAMDGVQKANSGHPGTAMALAPLTYLLWTRHMRYNPKNPAWLNRDRFILSAGHASMLIYSMLYLSGYDLPLEQLKNFRQW